MEKEISEEVAHAYDSGYRIGYRQAQRDLSGLIERDIPLEPIHLEGYDTWMCRACSGYIVDGSFCKHCGQRLKWRSDEDR